MCVFVSRPMKIVTFLRKNRETAKRVVGLLRERDTFRNKIMEIVKDFDEKSYNNHDNPGNRRGFLRLKPKNLGSLLGFRTFMFSGFFLHFIFFFICSFFF